MGRLEEPHSVVAMYEKFDPHARVEGKFAHLEHEWLE
jgi:hypothetical protein